MTADVALTINILGNSMKRLALQLIDIDLISQRNRMENLKMTDCIVILLLFLEVNCRTSTKRVVQNEDFKAES